MTIDLGGETLELSSKELRALAVKTLDQDGNDVPDFYLPVLQSHLQQHPFDTNFILELAQEKKAGVGGNGFGTITCMEEYCWQDIILDADPNRLQGGKSDGLGSFFNYHVHCLEEDHKKGRDSRIASLGLKSANPAKPATSAFPPAIKTTAHSNAVASSSKSTVKREPSRHAPASSSFVPSSSGSAFDKFPPIKTEFRGSLSHSGQRSKPIRLSSDPIYISSGEEESDDDVIEITGSQIPQALRKETNENDPFELDSDSDEDSTFHSSSAQEHLGPSLWSQLTQPNSELSAVRRPAIAKPAAPILSEFGGNVPSFMILGRAKTPAASAPNPLLSSLEYLKRCGPSWWSNEVAIAMNQWRRQNGQNNYTPIDYVRPRLSEVMVSTPKGENACMMERQVTNRLYIEAHLYPDLQREISERLKVLAQSIGPGTRNYAPPNLKLMLFGGPQLDDVWESHLDSYPRLDRTGIVDRTTSPRKPLYRPFPLIPPNRWNPQQNAAAGPSSLPISTESKADVKDLPLWASNLASQINTEVAGASEGLANWVRELQTTFGEVKTGLAGALGIGGQVDPFDEPDWGAERDRPVNAALSDFFKTALDDFQEDIDVEKALEALGLDRLEAKLEGMNVQLMPHQVIGVHWMVEQERKTTCQGGILGDAMGLGKTVQAIATMVKNPSVDRKIRTTLIVVPLPLLHQWKSEIESKSHLSATIYHGQGRTKSLNHLRNFDCVITTYSLLVSEGSALLEDSKAKKKRKQKEDNWVDDDEDSKPIIKQKGLLFKMAFHRIILDESANIRNKSTKASKCVHELISNIRWCLTGTLIYNSLDDIYPALRFVGVIDWDDFRQKVHSIAKNKPRLACRRSQAMLRKVMLRRTKDSELHGKKILQLPPKTTDMIELDFTEEERAIYAAIETAARVKVNKWFKAGTLLKQYHVVLVMLTRLRQLCCHPWLLRASDEYRDNYVELEENADEADSALQNLSEEEELARAEVAQGPVWVDEVRKKLEERYASMVAENDDADDNDFSCAICFEPYAEERITACKHSFCAQCIDGILTAPPRGEYDEQQLALMARQARPCPMCRAEVSRSTLYRASAFFDPTALEEDFNEGEGSEAEEDDGPEDVSLSKGKRRAIEIAVPRPKRSKGKGKAKAEPQDECEPENDLDNVDIEDVLPSTKMKRVGDLLDMWKEIDASQKTLIFCSFVEMLELMSVYLRKRGIVHVRYNGRMKIAEREEAIRQFKETGPDSPTVMLISLKCGGVGLNLTAANNVIGLDLAWSPASEAQAVDRAHRIGQTRAVSVKRLIVRDSVEERILALQEKKQALADGAMGEGDGGRLPRLSAGELVRLFGSDDD